MSGKLKTIDSPARAERISMGDRDLVVVVVNVREPALLPARTPQLVPLPGSGRSFGWKRWAAAALVAPFAITSALMLRGPADNHASVRITLPVTKPGVSSAEPETATVAVPTTTSPPAPRAHHGAQVAGAGTSIPPGKAANALVDIDKLPQVEAATRLALASGVAQKWEALGLAGMAVAGPLQLQDGKPCRTIAVLTSSEAGAAGTSRSLRCMATSGAWIRQIEGIAVPAPSGETATAVSSADEESLPQARPAP